MDKIVALDFWRLLAVERLGYAWRFGLGHARSIDQKGIGDQDYSRTDLIFADGAIAHGHCLRQSHQGDCRRKNAECGRKFFPVFLFS
jgi:hypothetical protein